MKTTTLRHIPASLLSDLGDCEQWLYEHLAEFLESDASEGDIKARFQAALARAHALGLEAGLKQVETQSAPEMTQVKLLKGLAG